VRTKPSQESLAVIAFHGLSCTAANQTFALEHGVHGIVRRSGIDDVPVTILSAKFIAATCRVEMSSIAKTQ
jgi:hypothetical protein